MGKYQYGGYCPKCVQPVKVGAMGTVFQGISVGCCPECAGKAPAKTFGGDPRWPQAPIRRVGFLWWARWEVLVPSEKGATDGTA